jgi:sec-independent protein translocase protein TatB
MGIPPTIEVANLGMADTLILMVLALVVFGPRRLPQMGRQIGKLMYEFRKASNDFKFQMEEELRNAEDADRRRKEEEERQRQLAANPPAQLEATVPPAAETPATETADLYGAPYGETPETRMPVDSNYPSIQPPSTGEPVPAEWPANDIPDLGASATAESYSAIVAEEQLPEKEIALIEPAVEDSRIATETPHNG